MSYTGRVTLLNIASHSLDTILYTLKGFGVNISDLNYPSAVLELADIYSKRGVLDQRDMIIINNSSFREIWLMDDYNIIKLNNININNKNLNRLEAVLSLSDISSNLINYYLNKTVETHVFIHNIKLEDSDIKKLIEQGVFIHYGLPNAILSKDMIILMTGREGLEEIIDKHGDYSKIINIIPAGKTFDDWIQSYTMMCYDVDEAIDYILTPWDSTVEHITFLSRGSTHVNTIEEFRLMRSWKMLYKNKPYIDFIFTYSIFPKSSINVRALGGRDKSLERIYAFCKNVVLKDSIIMFDKNKLYDSMRAIYGDDADTFIPKTRLLTEIKNYGFIKDRVVIVKPSGPWASSGRGITVVENEIDFNKAKRLIEEGLEVNIGSYSEGEEESKIKLGKKERLEGGVIKKKVGGKGKWIGIVSDYITNPLLYQGKKFHFRTHMIITTWGDVKWYDKFECLTAKLPYIKGDWLNKDIHDTHLAGTEKPTIFPDDFSEEVYDIELLGRNLYRVLDKMSAALKGKAIPYEECKYGYEFLGFDMLADDNYNVWILELNTMPGLLPPKADHDKTRNFNKKLMRWIYDVAIKPMVNLISSVRLVLLSNSNYNMRIELSKITSDPSTMSHIGRGNIWRLDTIENMYRQSLEDNNINSGYLDWIVTDNDSVVGYVGLRPKVEFEGYNKVKEEGDRQIRIIIGPKGKGYGKRVLSILSTLGLTGNIYAIVDVNNIPSIKLFESEKIFSLFRSGVKAYGVTSNIYKMGAYGSPK